MSQNNNNKSPSELDPNSFTHLALLVPFLFKLFNSSLFQGFTIPPFDLFPSAPSFLSTLIQLSQ